MKRFNFIALDYGRSFALDRCLRELAKNKRLSGFAIDVTSELWVRQASTLGQELPADHRLTLGLSLSFSPNKSLISADARKVIGDRFPWRSKFRLLTLFSKQWRRAVVDEIAAQVELFHRELGCKPSFIVGENRLFYQSWFQRCLSAEENILPTSLLLLVDRTRLAKKSAKKLLDAGYSMPPALFEMPRTDDQTQLAAVILKALVKLPNDTVILCSPAFHDSRLEEFESKPWIREAAAKYMNGDEFGQALIARDYYLF